MAYEKLLSLKFKYDFSDLNDGMPQVQKMARRLDKDVGQATKGLNKMTTATKNAGKQQATFNRIMRKGIKSAFIGVGAHQLLRFGSSALESASDLERSGRMIDVTFGDMSNSVKDFASTTTKQYGIAEKNARNMVGTFGMMFKTSGVGAENTRTMSQELTRLSADMASFTGAKPDRMFESMQSALAGNIRAMRMYGINLSSANLEQYRLAEGINVAYNEMNEASKMVLRYNYMIDASKDAHNDFANNSHTWANQMALLSAQWANLKTSIGQGMSALFLPIIRLINTVIAGLQHILDLLGNIFGFSTGIKRQVDAVGTGFQEATNKGTSGVGKMAKGVKKLKKEIQGLMGFDEINKLTETTKSEPASGGGGGAGGGAGGLNADITPKVIGVDKFEQDLNKIKTFVDTWRKELSMLVAGVASFGFAKWLTSLPVVDAFLGRVGYSVAVAMHDILGKIGGLFTNIKSLGFGGVVDVVHGWLGTLSNNIGGFVSDVFSWFKSFDGIGDLVVRFGASFKNVFLSLGGVMKTFGTHVLKFIVSPFTTAWKAFKLFATGLLSMVQAVLSPVNIFIGLFVATGVALTQLWHTNDEFRNNVIQAWENIKDVLSSIYEAVLKPVLEGIKDALLVIWENGLKPLWDGFVVAVEGISNVLLGLWNEILAPLVEYFVETWGALFGSTLGFLFKVFGNVFSSIASVLGKFLEVLGNVMNAVADKLSWVGDIVRDVLDSGFAVAIKNIVGYITDLLDRSTGIFDLLGNLLSDFKEHVLGGFIEGWNNAIENIKGKLTDFRDNVKNIMDTVKEFLVAVGNFVKTIFVDSFRNGLNAIKNLMETVFGTFGNIASRAWQAVIRAFSAGGKVMSGITEGIADTFKGVLRTILNGVNNVIAFPFQAIDSAIGRIRDVSVLGKRPFGFLPTIPVPRIPVPFASGGILKGEVFAQMGEYENARTNPEVIAPLDKLQSLLDLGGSAEEIALLREQNELLSKIASKDTNINLDGKKINKSNERIEKRNARMKGLAY